MLLVDATTAEHAPGGIRTVVRGFLDAAEVAPWRGDVAVALGPIESRRRHAYTPGGSRPLGRLRVGAASSRLGRLVFQRVALGAPSLLGRPEGTRIDRVLALDACAPTLVAGATRYAAFVHDFLALEHPEYWRPAEALVKRAAFDAVARNCTLAFTSSELNRSRVEATLGVDARVARFGCGQLTDAEADAALGRSTVTSRRGDYFLYVGAVEARKDSATLLRAFEGAAPRLGEDARLLIVGRPTEAVASSIERWRARSSAGERVALLGAQPRDEVLRLMRGARALVYPSRAEGFGLPVLEALALGVPAVASALLEIESWAGDACLSFAPGDARALEEMMVAAWRGEAPSAARGQDLARDYRWATFADTLVRGW